MTQNSSLYLDDGEYDREIDEQDELLMHNINTLPKKCKKYWSKRYSLFSKYDEGIYMTSDLWYSVTPEEIAIFTAQIVQDAIPECQTILDICCGGGGNTIQFANYFASVGAVDVNALNMKCTMHNASVYGVEHKIWSTIGDWNSLSKNSEDGEINMSWIPSELKKKSKPFDFIFCSPPWGGPSYNTSGKEYNLFSMEPFPIHSLCRQILQYTDHFGLFLPRNLCLSDLESLVEHLKLQITQIRVIYVHQEGYCKGILALFGPRFFVHT